MSVCVCLYALLNSPGISCRLLSTESQTRQCLHLAERLHLYVGWPLGGRTRPPPPSAHFRRRPRIIPSIALELSSFPSRLSSRRAPRPRIHQTPPRVHLSLALTWERTRSRNYSKTHSLICLSERCSSFLHNSRCCQGFGDKGGRRISRFTHTPVMGFATPRCVRDFNARDAPVLGRFQGSPRLFEQ